MRWVFLVNVGRLLLKAWELGIPVIVFTFYRSPEDQVNEFAAGRSRTMDSRHACWLAIDVALWDDMDKDGTVDKFEICWKGDARYITLGQYWESLGGVWGGRWEVPNDPYHFEWSAQMKL